MGLFQQTASSSKSCVLFTRPFALWLITNSETVKTRCVIDEQLSLARLADIVSFEKDIDSAVEACANGVGLGMFLSYMVAPYRKSGQLKYVLEKYETEPVPIQVVYPQARLMSNKVRVFVNECVGKLRRTKFD